MDEFMGLAGLDFIGAIERWIGRPLPDDFHAARAEEDARAIAEGLEAVAGAVAFIRGLPPDLPKAICSSSSSRLDREPSRPSRPRRRVRRHDLLAAASMSRAASRRPTSISTPPRRSACRSTASRSSRIRRSASQGALASGATVIGLRRRPPLPARPCRAAARARRRATSPTISTRSRALLDARAGGRCGRAWCRDRPGCARSAPTLSGTRSATSMPCRLERRRPCADCW